MVNTGRKVNCTTWLGALTLDRILQSKKVWFISG
jgi:hypothetical protein